MTHHVETYTELDTYGWQCFSPGCWQEATGFEDRESAETAGDDHASLDGKRVAAFDRCRCGADHAGEDIDINPDCPQEGSQPRRRLDRVLLLPHILPGHGHTANGQWMDEAESSAAPVSNRRTTPSHEHPLPGAPVRTQ